MAEKLRESVSKLKILKCEVKRKNAVIVQVMAARLLSNNTILELENRIEEYKKESEDHIDRLTRKDEEILTLQKTLSSKEFVSKKIKLQCSSIRIK